MVLYREVEAVKPGPSAATATAVFLACYAEQEVTAQVFPVSFLHQLHISLRCWWRVVLWYGACIDDLLLCIDREIPMFCFVCGCRCSLFLTPVL